MLNLIRESLEDLKLTDDFLSRHPHPKYYLDAQNGILSPATTAALRSHYEGCRCCSEAMEYVVALCGAAGEMSRQCSVGADVWEKAVLN